MDVLIFKDFICFGLWLQYWVKHHQTWLWTNVTFHHVLKTYLNTLFSRIFLFVKKKTTWKEFCFLQAKKIYIKTRYYNLGLVKLSEQRIGKDVTVVKPSNKLQYVSVSKMTNKNESHRTNILKAIKESPRALNIVEVSKLTNIPYMTARTILMELLIDGKLERYQSGRCWFYLIKKWVSRFLFSSLVC